MVLVVYRKRHVCQLLAISPSQLDRLVERGELPYTRLWDGGERVYLPEHIEQYVEKLRQRAVRLKPKNSGNHKS